MKKETFPSPYSIERVREVAHKFVRYSENLSEDEQIDFTQARMTRAKELREKYPDAGKYALWHVLIGSTDIESMPMTHEDFPSEDSIELFIDNLATRG